MAKFQTHSFHIPVMGIGFTIDTPVKVAHLGISSVVPLVDDFLMEKMREFYCIKIGVPFIPITSANLDARCKRITAYLNLVEKMAVEKFENLKNTISETGSEFSKYIALLPDFSEIKKSYLSIPKGGNYINDLKEWANKHLVMGSIDVNIMTKLDREHYSKGEKLSFEYNDAHQALKGFAESNLQSGVVLSAGMNPSLYAYVEQFEDFYPDANNHLKKKIILKVSDYRSALIQGKYFAKKGIWVSEFRVESSINCGGHAFVSNGDLMGLILEDFKQNKETLKREMFDLYVQALKAKERSYPAEPFEMKITAQGGVGKADEQRLLTEYFELDSVGWGSPFMLCPEATLVDDYTLNQLCEAKEEDLFLSNASPLGVYFNNMRGATKDVERDENVRNGSPGFNCTKRFCEVNKEFGDKAECAASKPYMKLKLAQLEARNLSPEKYKKEFDFITERSCICVGLGNSALHVNNVDPKDLESTISVCPGPNIAYFSKVVTLDEMVGHIYGRNDVVVRKDQPSMFIKEFTLYYNYLRDKILSIDEETSKKDIAGYKTFQKRLLEGVAFYRELFSREDLKAKYFKGDLISELDKLEQKLNAAELQLA